jgi:hypothetical protein
MQADASRGRFLDHCDGRSVKGVPHSLGALRKTFRHLRCDVCRRYALLRLGEHRLRDVDYRTRRFSCSACGAEATLTVTNPSQSRACPTIG